MAGTLSQNKRGTLGGSGAITRGRTATAGKSGRAKGQSTITRNTHIKKNIEPATEEAPCSQFQTDCARLGGGGGGKLSNHRITRCAKPNGGSPWGGGVLNRCGPSGARQLALTFHCGPGWGPQGAEWLPSPGRLLSPPWPFRRALPHRQLSASPGPAGSPALCVWRITDTRPRGGGRDSRWPRSSPPSLFSSGHECCQLARSRGARVEVGFLH